MLHSQTPGAPGESTTSRLVKIAKELGLKGSYTGIGARLFMVGTLTAFQFAIYGKFLLILASEMGLWWYWESWRVSGCRCARPEASPSSQILLAPIPSSTPAVAPNLTHETRRRCQEVPRRYVGCRARQVNAISKRLGTYNDRG